MRYFNWKLDLVSNILWLVVSRNIFLTSNLPQTPSNVKAIKLQKTAKIDLTWSLLLQSFHWVQSLVLKALQVCFRTLFRKRNKFWTKYDSFQQIYLLIETYNANKTFAENQFENILRLFDVLQMFPFTTSETMPNFYL